MSKIFTNINAIIFLLYSLINIILSKSNKISKDEIIYPSVLSLLNEGLVAVQKDGIYFFDANKVEDNSKKIIFKSPISSKEENEKISMCQFPEKEGGYI